MTPAVHAAAFLPAARERTELILALLAAAAAVPDLRGRVAVGGGAAMHLGGPVPARLTADLDLHHVCAAEGPELEADLLRAEAGMEEVVSRCGLPSPMRWRNETGARWLLHHGGGAGGWEALRVDLTTLTPAPLWPLERVTPHRLSGAPGPELPAMSFDEMAGNKVGTLFVRRRSRDLFDAHRLLAGAGPRPDPERLRVGFVLALAARPMDPRTFDPSRVTYAREEMLNNLVPYLPEPERDAAQHDPGWAERLLAETRDALSAVLPLRPHEREFVGRLRDRGELRPELLTGDAVLAERIRRNGTVLRPPAGAGGA
jgi:hypothetical protein